MLVRISSLYSGGTSMKVKRRLRKKTHKKKIMRSIPTLTYIVSHVRDHRMGIIQRGDVLEKSKVSEARSNARRERSLTEDSSCRRSISRERRSADRIAVCPRQRLPMIKAARCSRDIAEPATRL